MKLPKWLKIVGFVAVALATLLALTLAVEAYRGRRAWAACRARLEARGESFDWTRMAPPPVPDAENFAMTPLLAPFCDYVVDPGTRQSSLRDTNACERVKALFQWTGRLTEAGQGWRLGETVDLAAWQATLRTLTNSADPALRALAAKPMATPAADLLFLLGQNAAELDELRQAVRRPHTYFKTRYADGVNLLLPQLALFKCLARPFRVSAFAHLAAGDPTAAAADIEVLFALAERAGAEPLVICGLVQLSLAEFPLQPLWEGLVRHQWREPELARLETILARMNLVAAGARALRGERTFILTALGNPTGDSPPDADFSAPEMRALRMYPAGWRAQNQVRIAQAMQDLIDRLDAPQRQVRYDAAALDQLKTATRRTTPYNVFAALLVPAVVGVIESTAAHQASLTLARVAVALERHRLAHGRYPDALAALGPAFLDTVPPDPMTGRPLVYRAEAPDRYTLYSVGLNLADDGGQPARDDKGRAASRKREGDWAWPCAAALSQPQGPGGPGNR
jgi:hypothetical protein